MPESIFPLLVFGFDTSGANIPHNDSPIMGVIAVIEVKFCKKKKIFRGARAETKISLP